MALASIGVGMWIGFKKDCRDGYSGKLCKNCLYLFVLFFLFSILIKVKKK